MRKPARKPQWRSWRLWLTVGVLAASVAVITLLLPIASPVKRDVFTAKPLQKYLGSFEGAVYADTDCVGVDNNTKLNCIAIISRGGELEKYDYTHELGIPCLSRGEKVRVDGDQHEVLITRLSEPTMVHG